MTIEAVLFDYGLTLVTFSFPRQCLLAVLESFRPRLGRGAPSAEELIRQVLEPLEQDLEGYGEDEVEYLDFYERAWRRAGLDASRDLLYQILDQEQLCWDRAVELAPGALAVLERLRRRGLKTAVASNAPFPPELMRRQLRGNGIAERVDAIVFSADVGRRKPAAELYLAALAAVGAAPERALYVGDRYVEDYDGPRRVGMRAVLCTALARQKPPTGVPTIASLEELEGVL